MTNTEAALATVCTVEKSSADFGDYVSYLTLVTFELDGSRYTAVRFTRTDLGTAGVEIYRADGAFLGYAHEADTALCATAATILEWS